MAVALQPAAQGARAAAGEMYVLVPVYSRMDLVWAAATTCVPAPRTERLKHSFLGVLHCAPCNATTQRGPGCASKGLQRAPQEQSHAYQSPTHLSYQGQCFRTYARASSMRYPSVAVRILAGIKYQSWWQVGVRSTTAGVVNAYNARGPPWCLHEGSRQPSRKSPNGNRPSHVCQ